MGCDIHVHGEVKINGVWRHWSNPNVQRSYALFARMANVRNDGTLTVISEPRGIPEDATFETKFDCERWGVDGHSHSWLSGEEIELLEQLVMEDRKRWNATDYWYIEKEFGYVFSNGWNVQKYPRDYPQGVTEARIVFWFDN